MVYYIVIAFDRAQTIYVVFQSCRFYYVLHVLIEDARSFQALAAKLDWLTHLASISCWYQCDARQDEFRLKLLYCEFQKYEVATMSVIGGRPKKKKHANSSYKTTKHIERTFLVQRLITEVLYLWVKSIREEFSQHFCVSFRFSSFCGVKNHSFLSLSQCFAHHFGSELDYPSKQKEVQCWNCYSSDNNVTKNQ